MNRTPLAGLRFHHRRHQVDSPDPETLKPAEDAAYITLAQRWLLQEDPIIEAPFITFRDGYYYLFMSFNHCCIYDDTSYQMRVGRSKEVTGPTLTNKAGLCIWAVVRC